MNCEFTSVRLTDENRNSVKFTVSAMHDAEGCGICEKKGSRFFLV